jgi:hypothetical protein
MSTRQERARGCLDRSVTRAHDHVGSVLSTLRSRAGYSDLVGSCANATTYARRVSSCDQRHQICQAWQCLFWARQERVVDLCNHRNPLSVCPHFEELA